MFGTEKQIVHVEGMHCSHCAARVEKALLEVEGVKSAKVDLDKKIATIKAKPAISEEAAQKAIDAIGFKFAGLE